MVARTARSARSIRRARECPTCAWRPDDRARARPLARRKVTCETHYDYGFDEDVSATGHPSMFLKGGNDSNFGMVMTVLPSKSDGAFEDDSDTERPPDLETFQPARVTFYVRTDSPTSGARAHPCALPVGSPSVCRPAPCCERGG